MEKINTDAVAQTLSGKSSTATRKPLPEKAKANRVWSTLSEIFTARWFDVNGEEPSQVWLWKINSMSEEQLMRGLRLCSERVDGNGRGWMPNMPEFVALCKTVHPMDAKPKLPAPGHELREIKASAIGAGATPEELAGLDYNGIHAVLMKYRYGWESRSGG